MTIIITAMEYMWSHLFVFWSWPLKLISDAGPKPGEDSGGRVDISSIVT